MVGLETLPSRHKANGWDTERREEKEAQEAALVL